MHFSSPSGHRLSWWWPWNRGAVGFLTSGYSTVSTFRNISWKVTPNPLIGLRKSSTSDLPGGGFVVEIDAVVVRQVERRHREGARAHGHLSASLAGTGGIRCRETGGPLLRGAVPHRGQRDDDDQDHATHHVRDRVVRVEPPGAHGGDQQDPDDGDRDQDLPADRHQLVVPDPGQGPAQPDVAEQQDEDLDQEPQHRPPALVGARPQRQRPRRPPAAQEQRGGQRGDRGHVDVLAEVEHRELHRRVLGVIAGHQLALALGQVERQPVGLADHGDQVDHERDRQQPRVPFVLLRVDDSGGRQRARVEEHGHEGQAHGDLVADHLRGGAERAEQRVGRSGGPAGQHDPVHADRAHGQYEQHRHGQVGELQRGEVMEDRHFRPPRDDREGDKGDRPRQHGRRHEQQLVCARRDDVFLQRQLERVRDRLQQAEGPGPVGARPVLHPADHAAFEPDHEDGRQQQEEEDYRDLQQHQPPDDLVEVAERRICSGSCQHVRQRPCLHHSGLLSVTVVPCPAPSWARMVVPAWSASSGSPGYGGLSATAPARASPAAGSQTTWSAIGTTSTGTVTEPRSVATVTLSPSAMPASAAVAADILASTGRAVPASEGSPSCIRPLSSSWCQVASRTSSTPDLMRCCPGDVAGQVSVTPGGSGRVPRQAPSEASSARAAAVSGRPRCTSIWSAIAPSTYRSVRTSGTRSAAAKEPPRPSQFTNVPAFSAAAAMGNTTSARSVTALARSSRLTTNGTVSIARSAACGSGRSAGSTPAITRAASSPSAAAAIIAAVSRPGAAGSELLPQTLATSARAAGSVTGLPIGSSPGSAPASTAPRSPARRGTQASRAPEATASPAAAANAPGTWASRSPTRITAPGAPIAWPAWRQVSRSGALVVPPRPPWAASAVSAVASSPGWVTSSSPDSLARPGLASAAMENTWSVCRLAALRSRRNTMGDSSSGSNPASSTTGACSRSA